MKPSLKLVQDQPTERVFGSRSFISIGRNPALTSPRKFEPTVKRDGDVVL